MRFLRRFSIRLSNFTAGRRTDYDLRGFGESQPYIRTSHCMRLRGTASCPNAEGLARSIWHKQPRPADERAATISN